VNEFHLVFGGYEKKIENEPRFGNNSLLKFVFISLYEIDMNVIHLFILFEHRCHMHY